MRKLKPLNRSTPYSSMLLVLAADHLKIVFTQISEAVPEEPFMFALQVGEGDKYTGEAAASGSEGSSTAASSNDSVLGRPCTLSFSPGMTEYPSWQLSYATLSKAPMACTATLCSNPWLLLLLLCTLPR
jgi:hypothetical protein